MVCPKCGCENPDGAIRCYKCGEKLAKLCWKCSSYLPLDAQFCPGCGEKQEGFSAEFKKKREERMANEAGQAGSKSKAGKKQESLGSKIAGFVFLGIIVAIIGLCSKG